VQKLSTAFQSVDSRPVVRVQCGASAHEVDAAEFWCTRMSQPVALARMLPAFDLHFLVFDLLYLKNWISGNKN